MLLNFQNQLFSQINTKAIDIKDSSFITYDTNNIVFKTFYYHPFFDLAEKLPHGRYLVYEKDNKKNKALRLYGEYSDDSLKNGTFMYYKSFEINGKKENLAQLVYNYRNGKLDGPFSAYAVFDIYFTGNYNNGLKHGTFMGYSFGSPHYLENESIYLNDTLIKSIKYFKNSSKVISEIFEKTDSSSKYKITYFKENGLIKVTYVSMESDTFLKTKYNDKGTVESVETVNRIEEKALQQR